jgi:D-lactate dehydrogenase
MGTSVIIEDVVFPVRRMPEAIPELQDVIQRSGFTEGVIFGHAKEGNLHPVITQDFAEPRVVEQYAAFMDDLADLVINRYDGSFKGEHGTGRNVAPFVEMEWGEKAYSLMHRIKELFDPASILNPGVILNSDPKVHLKNLKTMPVFSEIADPCIECGFCEVRCPSQDLTLSPRQRIAVRRQIVELEKSRDRADRRLAKVLDEEYVYYGVDTCSVDGMCAMACPVKIDTGRVVKEIRARRRSRLQHFLADQAVSHFEFLTRVIRASLGATVAIEDILGKGFVVLMTKVGSAISFRALPALSREIPVPRPAPKLPEPNGTHHDRTVVYFPSCLTRTLGSIPGEKAGEGLAATLLYILEKGNWNVVYPQGLRGLCCGQPFSSKGFVPAAEKMATKLIRAFWAVTEEGKYPIVCDTSPCSGQIMRAGENLKEPELDMWRRLKIYDMPTFLVRFVLPEIENLEPLPVNAVLHPTCTIMKIGAHKDLVKAAEMCAKKVTVPVMAECCGFAGDRGFHHPELTLSATAEEAKEVQEYARCEPNSLFLSTCRTCEVGVTAGSGLPYQSLAYLVADAIRKSNDGPGKPERD